MALRRECPCDILSAGVPCHRLDEHPREGEEGPDSQRCGFAQNAFPFAEEGMSGSFLSQKGMCCVTGLHWVPGAPKASPICAER